MNTVRIGFVFAVVFALAFVTTTVFAQDTSAREKDRAEIEELMWRYTRALDTGAHGERAPADAGRRLPEDDGTRDPRRRSERARQTPVQNQADGAGRTMNKRGQMLEAGTQSAERPVTLASAFSPLASSFVRV